MNTEFVISAPRASTIESQDREYLEAFPNLHVLEDAKGMLLVAIPEDKHEALAQYVADYAKPLNIESNAPIYKKSTHPRIATTEPNLGR